MLFLRREASKTLDNTIILVPAQLCFTMFMDKVYMRECVLECSSSFILTTSIEWL